MIKVGIVDIKGGLGNQLFQLSFAKYLKSQGIKVYLDTSFFNSNHIFPRKLELDLSQFGFKEVKFKNNFIFRTFDSVFVEDDSFDNSDLKFINRFVGYYQNLKYVKLIKEDLYKILKLDTANKNKDLVALHIRKTDYSIIGQELSDLYYQNAINEILKINNKLQFDIFTDDENLTLDNNIYRNINKIYKPLPEQSAIDVIKLMINYKNYILANSSFSALAAYISPIGNQLVMYPNPWWKNSNVSLKGIPSSWIKVKN